MLGRWSTFIRAVVVLLVIAVPTRSLTAQEPPNYNENDRLRKALLEHYDKMALPHRDQNGTTSVEMSLGVTSFWFDEHKQIFVVNGFVPMRWQDPRLTWDYKNYGGLKTLYLGDDEAWKPDITLMNNADSSEVDHYGNTHLTVEPDGTVYWAPPATFQVECPIDLTYWPYDTQICNLMFLSWTTHGWQISLDIMKNHTKPYRGWFFKVSYEWQWVAAQLTRFLLTSSSSPEPYHAIEMSMTLRRTSPSFGFVVIIPAVVISLLTLLQFLLPLRESKRITVACTGVLLALLMLFYVASTLPNLAHSVPIIVKFYAQILVEILVSLVVAAVIMRLTDAQHPAASTPPPALLKTFLTGPVGSIMLLRKYMGKIGHSGGGDADAEVLEEGRPVSYAHEWLLVAAAVDRLAAVAFASTFVFTLIAYSAAL